MNSDWLCRMRGEELIDFDPRWGRGLCSHAGHADGRGGIGEAQCVREGGPFSKSYRQACVECVARGGGIDCLDVKAGNMIRLARAVEETAMLAATNKGKLRRDVDLIQKKAGISTASQAPSGLKLNIPEPIRLEEEAVPAPPPLPGRR